MDRIAGLRTPRAVCLCRRGRASVVGIRQGPDGLTGSAEAAQVGGELIEISSIHSTGAFRCRGEAFVLGIDHERRLPDTIDETKLEAKFDKGVLKVTAPKRPEAVKAEKRIEIKKA